jgi:hypothetical protein
VSPSGLIDGGISLGAAGRRDRTPSRPMMGCDRHTNVGNRINHTSGNRGVGLAAAGL